MPVSSGPEYFHEPRNNNYMREKYEAMSLVALKELAKVFPKDVREKRIQLLLEGHAVYVELEAMTEKGEGEYAKRLKDNYLRGNDVYSLGYRLIAEYFMDMQIQGNNATSFVKMRTMTDEIINKEAVITWPEGY